MDNKNFIHINLHIEVIIVFVVFFSYTNLSIYLTITSLVASFLFYIFNKNFKIKSLNIIYNFSHHKTIHI